MTTMYTMLLNPFWYGGGGSPSSASIFKIASGDHESSPTEKWNQTLSSSLNTALSGRHGRAIYDDALDSPQIDTGSNYASLAFGIRFQLRVLAAGILAEFRDTTSGQQVGAFVTAAGALRVMRGGGGGTQLAISSTGLIAINTYYRLVWRATIDNSAGSFDAYLYDDSNTLIVQLTGTGVDTQQHATNNFVRYISWMQSNIDAYDEDIWADVGAVAHTPCEVECLLPNGEGDLLQLTPNSGTEHYSRANEAPANGDTSYNSSTGDQSDCYTFADRSVAGTPLAVQVVATCKLTSGSPTIKLFCRIGGVTYEGATTHTITSSYRAWSEVWNNNPATGLAWTDSEINSAQFGVRCLATVLVKL